jgi:very-short-patch-repair endonuclease
MGAYIVDFFCDEAKLIVEVDGESHVGAEQEAKDRFRQQFLESLGYRVFRVTNDDVVLSLESVLRGIAQAAGMRVE